jgi:hypothetical protein
MENIISITMLSTPQLASACDTYLLYAVHQAVSYSAGTALPDVTTPHDAELQYPGRFLVQLSLAADPSSDHLPNQKRVAAQSAEPCGLEASIYQLAQALILGGYQFDFPPTAVMVSQAIQALSQKGRQAARTRRRD